VKNASGDPLIEPIRSKWKAPVGAACALAVHTSVRFLVDERSLSCRSYGA